MQEYYLLCKECNGYYKLEEWEYLGVYDNPQNLQLDGIPLEDLVCGTCGGELILVDDPYEYSYENHDEYEYEDYYDGLDESEHYYSYEKKKGRSLSKISLFLILLCIVIPGIFYVNGTWFNLFNSNDQLAQGYSVLGADSRGHVTKEVYSSSYLTGSNTKTIVIVTGIHPREELSKKVASDLIKKYSLSPGYRIIHYDITVTDNPDNYKIGRDNGEGLAANYVLPDILKSDNDLVIICHDHKPGYGEGFYIATPQMDEGSVKLAEMVNSTLPGFNYYRADNTKEHTTSAIRFSKPLASAGYKTFVYEIPEWVDYNEAYSMTYAFLVKCFSYLST